MKRIACLAVLLVLTACGSGSGGSDNSSSAKPSAGSTQTAKDADSGDKNPVNGKDLCAFLTKMAPRLKTDGSTAGALADLAIELATWIGDHPEQKPRTSADLDDAAQKNCPDVRTQVAGYLGTKSFAEAF